MIPDSIEFLFVLLSGLALGSFVTLASWRLPREEDIVVKPSRCPNCDTALKVPDLFPVLSWICSRGCCSHCKVPVSWRYPLIEIATASIITLLYFKYGLTSLGVVLSLTWVALMVMIVVDFEHYIIPDSIHVVLAALAIAYHMLVGTERDTVVGGLLLGAAIGLTLHYGYRIVRKKEGLGFGDVKFLMVAGLWLGLLPIVPFLFFSGVFGVLTGLVWRVLGKGERFPFGPSLALSMFLCIVVPDISNLFWNIGKIANNTIN